LTAQDTIATAFAIDMAIMAVGMLVTPFGADMVPVVDTTPTRHLRDTEPD